MGSYDTEIAAVAGTDADVRYDGDVLTNGADHAFLAQLAARIDTSSTSLTMPPGVMAGATADAIDSKLAGTRADFEKVADALAKIAGAAQKASPTIASGTSKDAAVKEALTTSSAVYREVASLGDESAEEVDGAAPNPGKGTDAKGDPKGTDTGATERATPEGKTPKGANTPPTTHDREVGKGSTPQTATSSDQAPQNQQAQGQPVAQPQPAVAAPQQQVQQPLTGVGGLVGMQQSGAPQRPVGGTSPSGISREDLSRMISEVARGTGTDRDSGSGASRGIKPERGHTPVPEGTDTGGSTTAVAAVPVGNPSVVGAPVDPAQTAGRTTSTAAGSVPSAPPVAARPSASPMGMGTMGGMAPMGPMGAGGGGAAPAAAPPLAVPRDKASERVFTGEAARDKALISSILHDGGEFTAVDDETDDEDELDERRNPPRPELADDERW